MTWSRVTQAPDLLGWRARHDLARMCADSWRWQLHNPEGYAASGRTLVPQP